MTLQSVVMYHYLYEVFAEMRNENSYELLDQIWQNLVSVACLGPSSFELICKVAKAILHGQLDHFLS